MELNHTFSFGVLDVFPLIDSEDLVVTGKVKGGVCIGDNVCLSNMGDDDGKLMETVIVGIETAPNVPAQAAVDCLAGLRLRGGKQYPIKKGTVLFSKETSIAQVHQTYISALGDAYVAGKNLELSEQELEELSITDCAEIWRLYVWFQNQQKIQEQSEAVKQEKKQKLDILCKALGKKILEAEAVYCVYNKATGEPHMFSRTIDQKDGTYRCTPPDILIYTEAYKRVMESRFPEEQFEIKRIENGEDKKGIYNFLGSAFYLNGACGVNVLAEHTAIGAPMLVPAPDYSNVNPQNIPVTNPDLVRWMLLMGQIGEPDTDDKKLIYNLYFKFMSREMVKAKLLVPIQSESGMPEPDENGKVVLPKEMRMKFPTMPGKSEKQAVRMYTDWKRLRMVYGNEWSGMVQPIEGMIQVFDCAVNVTEYTGTGCYVSDKTFEDMKKL